LGVQFMNRTACKGLSPKNVCKTVHLLNRWAL
jgi:hypothetical protein